MMKQNNPLRRLLAALLAALTLVSFTILPVLGAAEDEAADTEAAETTICVSCASISIGLAFPLIHDRLIRLLLLII